MQGGGGLRYPHKVSLIPNDIRYDREGGRWNRFFKKKPFHNLRHDLFIGTVHYQKNVKHPVLNYAMFYVNK